MSFWTTSPTRTSLAAATASFTSEQVPSRNSPEFPRSQRLADVLSLDLLILGEAGEVEQPDVQPLLVEAIHRHRQVKGIGPDDPVLGLPAEPRLVARCGPDVLLAPRHDDDVGLDVHGEFERPGEDDRAVLGLDRDPGASPGERPPG